MVFDEDFNVTIVDVDDVFSHSFYIQFCSVIKASSVVARYYRIVDHVLFMIAIMYAYICMQVCVNYSQSVKQSTRPKIAPTRSNSFI